MGPETEQQRSKRRHQRTLFDGAAQLYEASRLGYPGDIVTFAVATAALGAGSAVLEVGCGTGQLTERLARFGFRLTAIDLGPSLIAAARRRLVLGMWAARSDDNGAWIGQHTATDAEVVAGTGLFETPVHTTHEQRIVRPVEAVIGVENTRATSLSWPDDIRREFTEELRHRLRFQTEVQLTQRTLLTMARVLPPAGR